MSKDELIALAKAEAQKQGVDPALVCAICEQESDWDAYAMRYEPGFYKVYLAAKFPSPSTESLNEATSFGLMQVMGLCAREMGFKPALGSLLDPQSNLEWGCRLLKRKLAKASGNVADALLLWNGGNNRSYPAQVLARKVTYA